MAKNPRRDPPSEEKREINRKLVLRALTDPKFRELLATEPEKALGIEVTDLNRDEIRFILATVNGVEYQISSLADELLCANGGPCGIG